jgi:hypothetical protein
MPWSTKKHKGVIEPRLTDDFPEPGSVSDFLALMNELYPRTLDLRSWPRYRQGGAVRQWKTGGTHNYTDPNGFVQIGSALWSGSASTHAWVTVTLPSIHSGLPIAFATIMQTVPQSTSAWCTARPVNKLLLGLDWWSAEPVTEVTIA